MNRYKWLTNRDTVELSMAATELYEDYVEAGLMECAAMNLAIKFQEGLDADLDEVSTVSYPTGGE